MHSDLCGPLPVPSFQNKWYIATFIDEKSRHAFAVPLQKKSDAKHAFHKYRIYFEKHFGKSIKCLVSDNGGEYIAMQEYLEEHGIRAERTAPYTPEQNGIAERMNRTLMEMVRTLLKQSGLDERFWVEALMFAVDVRNNCATKSLGGKMLEREGFRNVFYYLLSMLDTVRRAYEGFKRIPTQGLVMCCY